MKKLLLLLILFSTWSTSSTRAQTTFNASPSSSFVGVTKKGTTYSEQKLKNNYSPFFVGYDAAQDMYGRAYLEFDLRSIPPKATITSAVLKLRNYYSGDSNFSGNLSIKSSNKYTTANESTWNSLKGVLETELVTGKIKEMNDVTLSSSSLNSAIKASLGKNLCLTINIPDESKIIRFAGDILSTSLDITYTEEGDNNSGGSSNSLEMLPIPKEVLAGEEFTLGFVNDPGTYYIIKKWEYDTDVFTEKSRTKGTITLTPKPLIGSKHAYIKLYVETDKELYIFYNKYDWTWGFPIKGVPMITTPEKNTCAGNTISYNIENFTGPYSNISWQSGTNMSLISTTGSNAVFRASGNGFGTVKAKVIWNGKTYNLENSSVWTGIPQTPNIKEFKSIPQEFSPRTNYTFDAASLGVTIDASSGYIWNIQGAATIIQTNLSSVTIQTSSSTLSSPFTLTVKAFNKCGQSPTFTGYGTVKGTGGEVEPPITEKSIMAPESQPEIKSVKIYNLSGILVYSNNTVNGSFDIKSTALTDGIYIVEKFDGKNKTSEKIILKR